MAKENELTNEDLTIILDLAMLGDLYADGGYTYDLKQLSMLKSLKERRDPKKARDAIGKLMLFLPPHGKGLKK